MLDEFKAAARHKLLEPVSYWTHRAWATLEDRDASLWLLISDGQVYTSDQQYAPLKRHAAELRRRLGVVFRFMPLEQAAGLSRDELACFDVVGIKLGFRT